MLYMLFDVMRTFEVHPAALRGQRRLLALLGLGALHHRRGPGRRLSAHGRGGRGLREGQSGGAARLVLWQIEGGPMKYQ